MSDSHLKPFLTLPLAQQSQPCGHWLHLGWVQIEHPAGCRSARKTE